MALVASIQLVWPRLIALYKLLSRHHLPPTLKNVFASFLRRFASFLRILHSTWQMYGKKRPSKPPSLVPGSSDGVESGNQTSEHIKEVDATNTDKMDIPIDNVSCSLYPFGTGLHDASRSSQMLNASRSSHNLGIVFRSRNTSWSSHNVESSNAQQSPIGGGYTFTIEPTSPHRTYSMSSPELGRPRAADLQRGPYISQFFPQPRSDSPVESIQLLPPGDISSSRHRIPPALGPLIEQSIELGAAGTASQSRISSDDLQIPPLDSNCIYPMVPEFFQRYEKRRRM